ncbi:heparinase II/III domain-containing protein [Paenibacillus qinlingensis]|uniref:heparinase II/III domain-containing protein n=1 Tax=Paenibacillus qinlingensis TaxID=1837343 RepID=UPI001563C019|nr:heparinase II/III family protein [Paenibacillus qinlingensis]NQX59245.1 heparinase II/III family protein [Paenibacillus qinlingensis]
MDMKRLERLRGNADKPEFQAAMALLRRDAEEAAKITFAIRSHEQGEWMHYYYCDEDGTRLTFQWDEPFLHLCSTCGKERRNEQLDRGWTSIAHSQIGRAVYHIALLYTIEPDAGRLEFVKSYLMAYANHYETYAIHGDIPYNGPGKLFAQTLDEAHWITDLALGFDVIQVHLTRDEITHIRHGLLEPCVRFLIAHKEEQIHNHSVLITSAIAALGLLLHDREIIDAGLAGEYGLHDQLQRGIFEDGLWYEGNVQYHFYAFQSLLHYALIAEGTEWDVWQKKALKAMFDFPLQLILPNGVMPTLNDAGLGHHIGTYAPYYEIAYDIYGEAKYCSLLQTAYGMDEADPSMQGVNVPKRDSVYALMFGGDLAGQLVAASDSLGVEVRRTRSLPESGLTKLVNKDGWHVIVKHSRFGGEHDHMDRLGLSIMHGDIPVLVDPGTTAYGIPVHYGWFKHTYSHNTVSIDGADQPPQDGRWIQMREEPWGVWLETAVDWLDEDYAMKNRIIMPAELNPWDADAYEGVQIRRINLLAEDHLLDIVHVIVPVPRVVHVTNHFSGRLQGKEDAAKWSESEDQLSRLDQQWFNEKRKLVQDMSAFEYQMKEGTLEQHVWCSQPTTTYTALTPDNPPSGQRTSFITTAAVEQCATFVQLLHIDGSREAKAQGHLEIVALPNTSLQVVWNQLESQITYDVQLNGEKADLSRRHS